MPFRPSANLVCMGLHASPWAELCLRTLVVVLGAQVIFDMSEFPKALEKGRPRKYGSSSPCTRHAGFVSPAT
jgi:hypothetical protein